MPDRDTAFQKVHTYTILIMVFLGIFVLLEIIKLVKAVGALLLLHGVKEHLGSYFGGLQGIVQFMLLINIVIILVNLYLIKTFYSNLVDISNEEIPEFVAWRFLLWFFGIQFFLKSIDILLVSKAPSDYFFYLLMQGALILFCYQGYRSLENLAYILSADRIVSSGIYSNYREDPEDSYYYSDDRDAPYTSYDSDDAYNRPSWDDDDFEDLP